MQLLCTHPDYSLAEHITFETVEELRYELWCDADDSIDWLTWGGMFDGQFEDAELDPRYEKVDLTLENLVRFASHVWKVPVKHIVHLEHAERFSLQVRYENESFEHTGVSDVYAIDVEHALRLQVAKDLPYNSKATVTVTGNEATVEYDDDSEFLRVTHVGLMQGE